MEETLHTLSRDLEMERMVLGIMMVSDDGISDVTDILQGEDFSLHSNRMMFEILRDQFHNGEAHDALTLISCLKDEGKLDDCGGPLAIMDIESGVVTDQWATSYAGRVKEKSRVRHLLHISQHINTSLADGQEFEAVADGVVQRILSMREESRSFVSLEQALGAVDWDEPDGLPTGFKRLDRIIGGFRKGELVIVGGATSSGKSALAKDFAVNIARTGIPVAIFSLEMATSLWVRRMVASEARVSVSKTRRSKASDEEWERITYVLDSGEVRSWPILIDDQSGLTPLQLRSTLHKMTRDHGVKIAFVDYLQLLSPGSSQARNREQEVASISGSLKSLARDLDIPLVVMAQLSRKVDDRPQGRPRLSDLRESGRLEQDADTVMFVYHPSRYGVDELENGESAEGLAEIIVAKQRSGPTASSMMEWAGEYTRFVEVVDMDEEGPPF